jgi:hypothetical protein
MPALLAVFVSISPVNSSPSLFQIPHSISSIVAESVVQLISSNRRPRVIRMGAGASATTAMEESLAVAICSSRSPKRGTIRVTRR